MIKIDRQKIKKEIADFKPQITTIDRYIIRKFIGTFFSALLIIIGIVIIFDLSEKIDNFVEKSAPLKEIIFNYYANFIPYFMNMFSPMFVFITVIFFTSKMAANSEIIAILAGGISFKRFLWPYFVSSAFIVFFTLILNLYVIPPC
ncbi:MAG: LptF/LptG family permease, partial [Candidatus Egerieousia sp.]